MFVRLLAVLLSTVPLLAEVPPPSEIARIVGEAMEAQLVPGVAVAVVAGDRTVYLAGHGVREVGKTPPVTPDTLFCIGSLTKAFTSAALGMLVDEGRLRLDDSVRRYLPWFTLADPLAAEQVTIRDLLLHRTGLDRHDLLWSGAPWSLEESVRRIGHVPLSYGFRSRYSYQNVMYNAAGLVIAAAAGMPWHEYVERRILRPLAMRGAVFTSGEAVTSRDWSAAHRYGAGSIPEAVPWYHDDGQIRAAGSIKAGVRDLAQWMRLHLNEGVFDGKRLLTEKTFRDLHAPQIRIPDGGSYALAWQVNDHKGHVLWSHGGAVAGFRAHIVLAPGERTGVAVLTNLDESWIHQPLAMRITEALLNVPSPAPFTAPAKKPETKPAKQAVPLAQASRYRGRYTHPGYGDVRVKEDGAGLTMAWSGFRVPLRHLGDHLFETSGDPRIAGQEFQFAGDTLRALGVTFRRATPDPEARNAVIAARVADALRVTPGERVYLTGPATKLQDAVRTALLARAARMAATLDEATAAVVLPGEYGNMASWLDRGGVRRAVHFHWDDGSRHADGLNTSHDEELDDLYAAALDIDYGNLRALQQRAAEILRLGTVRVSTSAGTDLMFRVGVRPFNLQDGDASPDRGLRARMRIDRDIELPAGALRVAPIEESAMGVVVLPEARFGEATARQVALYFDNGKITRIRAEQGQEAVEAALKDGGEGAMRFREFALGFNPKLAENTLPGVIPYYGYGAGVVRVSLGDNEEMGGAVRGGPVRWFFLPDATVHVDFRYLVRNGKLMLTDPSASLAPR
ncbi:MAG: serine hydrolase [Bryobacterales bacterium]|nr:serine hydrolase [Bryobacterales bacterium]